MTSLARYVREAVNKSIRVSRWRENCSNMDALSTCLSQSPRRDRLGRISLELNRGRRGKYSKRKYFLIFVALPEPLQAPLLSTLD